jgi:hypothetical protein
MQRIIVVLLASIITLGVLETTAAAQHALGDLGKPLDYDKTIKRFRTIIPNFDAYVAQVLPTAYDWRAYGMVTPAKDQGNCGSCWAFASVGTLESKILMMGRSPYDISEQQQVSCNTAMLGCNGGYMTALQFWYTEGPMLESCTGYPSYGGAEPDCESLAPCSQLPYHTMNYYTVNTSDINEIKTSLYNDGPTYFSFYVYADFFTFWDTAAPGTVYVNSSSSYEGGHAVLIIGWDDSKGAWLLKNSWGATGGPNGDGTFWMAYTGHAHNLSFGMPNVEVNYTTPKILHRDGAIYSSSAAWNAASPPYYPGTNYAMRLKTKSDGSTSILHTDGAIWNSTTGWETGTPPYYPGTAYAKDLVITPGTVFSQPADSGMGYASQDFVNATYDNYDIALADDFSISQQVTITSIFIPGFVTSGNLSSADMLNWRIYANASGVPAGNPFGGGSSPLWSVSLVPTDPHCTLSGNDVTLSVDPPQTLPAGTYWLVFYPRLDNDVAGQYYWLSSMTTNGYTAQYINPGGDFLCATVWTPLTEACFGGTEHDLAFQIGIQTRDIILHKDGALWSSVIGWTLTTPPYYPNTDYARALQLRADASYAILHRDGAIYDSATGWVVSSPPYHPGTNWAVDMKLDGSGYVLLHRDGAIWSSTGGWIVTAPPYYPTTDYARGLELVGSKYIILHKDGTIFDSMDGWYMGTPPYYPGTNYAVDLEVQ